MVLKGRQYYFVLLVGFLQVTVDECFFYRETFAVPLNSA